MSTKRAGKVGVGDWAPDFALPSQYGETARLGDLIGEKAIVLYFYPKDDTPDAPPRRAPSGTATRTSWRPAPRWSG